MIKTSKFARKPFYVDAVQVTAENMKDVAKWCQGDVRTMDLFEGKAHLPYIKVRVHQPLTDRQTQAYVGDWILSARTGFKVYRNLAFEKNFVAVNGEKLMPEDDILYKQEAVEV